MDEFKDWFDVYDMGKPIKQLCDHIAAWCDWSNAYSPSRALRDKLLKVAALYEISAKIKSEGKMVDRKPLDVWDDLAEELQHDVFSWLGNLDQLKNGAQETQVKPDSCCTSFVNRLYRINWEPCDVSIHMLGELCYKNIWRI